MLHVFSRAYPTKGIWALILFTCVTLAHGICFASDIKQEMTAAVDGVRPALVLIRVVSADYNQGREVKVESSGSGVIISPEGYTVTNHHVAGDAERIMCTLADKREVEAKLVGTDPLADIAVIKLESSDGKPFPTAKWGDSTKLEVGDRVYAMGCPYALSQSVTNGIISNVEMVMPSFMSSSEFTLDGEDVGSIVRWIGHDALIRPGNSGGALINRDGELCGINEISMGLSGAIPSNLAKRVVEQLINGGKVVRGWIGLEIQPLLKSSGLDKGILVSGVMDDSPAKKAGFKSGDILTKLDGQDVVARFREQIPLFNQFVADLSVGKAVDAEVQRDGKPVMLKVNIAEREKAIDKQHEIRPWGICATNITYLALKEMELGSQDGVIVSGVLPSGPAGSAKPAIEEGDVIVKVNGIAVKDLADFRTLTKQITDGQTDPVNAVVLFDRTHELYATVVKIGKQETSGHGTEVRKAWLPVDTQVITRELAEGLGIKGKTGVRVTRVHPQSSAAAAGIKVGDLIIRLDGEEIPAEQVEDDEVFPSMIRQYDIGATASLNIVRDSKPLKIDVKLEATPKLTRDYVKHIDDDFEFTTRDIAFSDESTGNIAKGAAGVYVESVSDGGWAALGGLCTSDVITDINGKSVANLDELKTILADIKNSKPKSVVIKVSRGIHTTFLEMEPDWTDIQL